MRAPESIWRLAESAVVAGDEPALGALLLEHGEFLRTQPPQSAWGGGLAPDYSAGDARTILTREHQFATFDELARHLRAVHGGDPPTAPFEAAVDAVVSGDLASLGRILQAHPELIRARSARRHGATLLHYVGANGVEGWRQRTPPNAVGVAALLLEAGAEVDAVAPLYGGATTLGLVATSIFPLRAGVQNDLLDFLLRHGASLDRPQTTGQGQGIVNGCLANGRPEAAAFLAERGARLDLEGAAGLGRLDRVQEFVDAEGRLMSGATRHQLHSGFQWACEYGRADVLDYLLECGVAVGELHRGQTGLHWAALGGHSAIVQRLLVCGAPVDVADERWNSTPLGWALHGWEHRAEGAERAVQGEAHYDTVARLVAAGARVRPEWTRNAAVQADPRMLGALRGTSTAD